MPSTKCTVDLLLELLMTSSKEITEIFRLQKELVRNFKFIFFLLFSSPLFSFSTIIWLWSLFQKIWIPVFLVLLARATLFSTHIFFFFFSQWSCWVRTVLVWQVMKEEKNLSFICLLTSLLCVEEGHSLTIDFDYLILIFTFQRLICLSFPSEHHDQLCCLEKV